MGMPVFARLLARPSGMRKPPVVIDRVQAEGDLERLMEPMRASNTWKNMASQWARPNAFC